MGVIINKGTLITILDSDGKYKIGTEITSVRRIKPKEGEVKDQVEIIVP